MPAVFFIFFEYERILAWNTSPSRPRYNSLPRIIIPTNARFSHFVLCFFLQGTLTVFFLFVVLFHQTHFSNITLCSYKFLRNEHVFIWNFHHEQVTQLHKCTISLSFDFSFSFFSSFRSIKSLFFSFLVFVPPTLLFFKSLLEITPW